MFVVRGLIIIIDIYTVCFNKFVFPGVIFSDTIQDSY